MIVAYLYRCTQYRKRAGGKLLHSVCTIPGYARPVPEDKKITEPNRDVYACDGLLGWLHRESELEISVKVHQEIHLIRSYCSQAVTDGTKLANKAAVACIGRCRHTLVSMAVIY